VRGRLEGRRVNFVANINELALGSIVREGKKYRPDVLILADGTVNRWKNGLRKESKLTGSTIL
jgi:hypothetical protein